MRTNPLRAEFVLTGFAFLLACFAMYAAVGTTRRDCALGSYVIKQGGQRVTVTVNGKTTSRVRGGRKVTRCRTPLGWLESRNLTGSGAVGLALLIGSAYAFGIALVQLTFFWPTMGMIGGVRKRRFAYLRHEDEQQRERGVKDPAPNDLLARVFADPEVDVVTFSASVRQLLRPPQALCGLARLPARFLALYGALPGVGKISLSPLWALVRLGQVSRTRRRGKLQPVVDAVRWLLVPPSRPEPAEDELAARDNAARRRHATTLALTVGRAGFPTELADEYRYRRSNRQIFVGMLPSASLSGAAGMVALWSHDHRGWAVAALIGTYLLIRLLYESALYQEKVAQDLIIDTAFLQRWKIRVGAGEAGPRDEG